MLWGGGPRSTVDIGSPQSSARDRHSNGNEQLGSMSSSRKLCVDSVTSHVQPVASVGAGPPSNCVLELEFRSAGLLVAVAACFEMMILDSRVLVKISERVEMCHEQHEGRRTLERFGDRPGNAGSVAVRCPPSELIYEHQTLANRFDLLLCSIFGRCVQPCNEMAAWFIREQTCMAIAFPIRKCQYQYNLRESERSLSSRVGTRTRCSACRRWSRCG